MVMSTGPGGPGPEVNSLIGLVSIEDVDRGKVEAIVTREGSEEPDFLLPTAEAPPGVNPERWREMAQVEESVDEAAIIVLGERPEEDVLISTTYLVVMGGQIHALPSLALICPFKPDVFTRFPGYGRGKYADETTRRE